MWKRRETSRALLVALLALVISLLTVRKEKKLDQDDNEFDAYGFCDITPADNTSCLSVHGLLVLLSEFCGLKDEEELEDSTSDLPLTEEETESLQLEHDPKNDSVESTQTQDERPTTKQNNEAKTKEDSKKEESSPVIYQIIGLLLIVSVAFSLVECSKEKWARKKQAALAGSTGVRKSLSGRQEAFAASRRMSLADLTISRHERKENQASYRHPAAGKQRTKNMDKTEFSPR